MSILTPEWQLASSPLPSCPLTSISEHLSSGMKPLLSKSLDSVSLQRKVWHIFRPTVFAFQFSLLSSPYPPRPVLSSVWGICMFDHILFHSQFSVPLNGVGIVFIDFLQRSLRMLHSELIKEVFMGTWVSSWERMIYLSPTISALPSFDPVSHLRGRLGWDCHLAACVDLSKRGISPRLAFLSYHVICSTSVHSCHDDVICHEVLFRAVITLVPTPGIFKMLRERNLCKYPACAVVTVAQSSGV